MGFVGGYTSSRGNTGVAVACASLVLALLVQPVEAFWPFKSMKDQPHQEESATELTEEEPAEAIAIPQEVVKLSNKAVEERTIRQAVAKLLMASNNHDLKTLLSYYSQQFTSGDRMDLKTIKAMIEETWEMYPDIRYSTKILQIRLNGDWATVETEDSSIATAKTNKTESGKVGKLISNSRTLMFWHKVGNRWLIESDATLYEEASIRFGDLKGLEVRLAAPDQVFSGEGYTAKVTMPLDGPVYAIAAINREPIIFPHTKVKERYRTLSQNKPSLERVFEANTDNRNELVSATIGLIEVVRDENQRPQVRLNGLATLVKRVNVLPQVVKDADTSDSAVVKTSADGRIDLTQQAGQSDGPEGDGLDSVLPTEEQSPEESAE